MVPWILEVDREGFCFFFLCDEGKQCDGKKRIYKIPGLESIWFTQSCHMTGCYLPQCSLGCAISEKKHVSRKF